MRNDFVKIQGGGTVMDCHPPPPAETALAETAYFFVNKLNTVNKKTIKSQMYKKIQTTDPMRL